MIRRNLTGKIMMTDLDFRKVSNALKWVLLSFYLGISVGLGTSADAQEGEFILQRNTSLTLPDELPASEWKFENAFGVLFDTPIGMAVAPGEPEDIFILERAGRIIKFHIPSRRKRVFLDLRGTVNTSGEGGLLGAAFHPDYRNNGRFFVFYTLNAENGSGSGFHARISRFERNPENPHVALTGSEAVLISQYHQANNHNGGDLHFGPDGYLYAALGDEGRFNDFYDNSQLIDKDFFSGIIRLDVDEKPENLAPNAHPASVGNYHIPADNPYVGVTEFRGRTVRPNSVRTEFYAIGLRNPWRMSFDSETGALYVGDVGQNAREEINIIVKGGNYGWAYREGTTRGPNFSLDRDFNDPIHEYLRGLGTSVTGGVVYRGARYPELYGKYIFGDYVSGRLWTLESDGSQNRVPSEIILTDERNISGFGIDPINGDVLAARLLQRQISRLVKSDESPAAPLPQLLSETGAFSDLATLTPETGIYPYELNQPFWSDGADKKRWFALPDGTGKFNFAGDGSMPTGSFWVKHFDLEMVEGDPNSSRRLETRFIIKTSDHVYGLTYKWNDAQTDATLVPAEGSVETFEVTRNGQKFQQTWSYPSRSACLNCHSKASGGILGFSPFQMDRAIDWPAGEPVNQLDFLESVGALTEGVANHPSIRTVGLDDTDATLEQKVLSYLHVNCASCHQPGGPAIGSWDARLTTPLREKNLINGALSRQTSDGSLAVVVPGNPDQSSLFNRIAIRGDGQMPPIASHQIDSTAVELVREWITQTTDPGLPPTSWTDWFQANFGSQPDGFTQAGEDADKDKTPEYIEYLLETDPNDPESGWKFQTLASPTGVTFNFPAVPDRGFTLVIETSDTPNGPWLPTEVTLSDSETTTHVIETQDKLELFFRVILKAPL